MDCHNVSDSQDSIPALASHQMCSWIAFKGSSLRLETIACGFTPLGIISLVKKDGGRSTEAAAFS